MRGGDSIRTRGARAIRHLSMPRRACFEYPLQSPRHAFRNFQNDNLCYGIQSRITIGNPDKVPAGAP
jgi:hypothetical protein